MLEFTLSVAKERVTVTRGVNRLAELRKQQDKRWLFTWFNNFEVSSSADLRQIADKLDELNGNKK